MGEGEVEASPTAPVEEHVLVEEEAAVATMEEEAVLQDQQAVQVRQRQAAAEGEALLYLSMDWKKDMLQGVLVDPEQMDRFARAEVVRIVVVEVLEIVQVAHTGAELEVCLQAATAQ